MVQVTLWGVTASPYLLKMQSLVDYAELSWQRLPGQGRLMPALRMALRLSKATRRGAVERFPARDPILDEYPSVPFYAFEGQSLHYDSSGFALHLDARPDRPTPPLVPEDPAQAFVAHLIDEALDEFGLYMVHHQRWVGSARSTQMGDRTAAELRVPRLLRGRVADHFYRRQTRRLPYLFSVAPAGYDAGVVPARTPPARAGFPPTHQLLEDGWLAYLAAVEALLAQQPYLLGDRFTLADASVYGQLGMNLVDGESADHLARVAPLTFSWLCAIRDGQHRGSRGELALNDSLAPLITIVKETFLPLMQQNEAAYQAALGRGQTLFNEAAFDAGQALYNGELMGHPFRAVVKTFQVQVWRDLKSRWQALEPALQGQLAQHYGLQPDQFI